MVGLNLKYLVPLNRMIALLSRKVEFIIQKLFKKNVDNGVHEVTVLVTCHLVNEC